MTQDTAENREEALEEEKAARRRVKNEQDNVQELKKGEAEGIGPHLFY